MRVRVMKCDHAVQHCTCCICVGVLFTFFVHRSSGSHAILTARRHFILLCFSNPAWDFGCSHPFNGCSCASFHVFDPLFLFKFSCVNHFIGVFHDGDVAVFDRNLCLSCVHHQIHLQSFPGFLHLLFHPPFSSLPISSFALFSFWVRVFFLIFSFRLNDEEEHFFAVSIEICLSM